MKKISDFDKNVVIFIGITVFLSIGCAILFANHRHYDLESPVDSKILADYGGFLSGAFGTAGFIILLITYRKQSEELEYARKESEMQTRNFHIQRFENTFFNLISLQMDSFKVLDRAFRINLYNQFQIAYQNKVVIKKKTYVWSHTNISAFETRLRKIYT
jgi:hypothetical protein